MKTNMVILTTDKFAVRAFVGDFDRAVELAHFFKIQRWGTEVREVEMEEHPRSLGEQEAAAALVHAFDAWRNYALPKSK